MCDIFRNLKYIIDLNINLIIRVTYNARSFKELFARITLYLLSVGLLCLSVEFLCKM